MPKMNSAQWVAFVLVVIGGLNWGLVGAFDFNLVEAILGTNVVTDIVYVLVGLSALYMIFAPASMSKKQAGGGGSM